MRIVYGVSGEGFGHSSRAKEVISNLILNKHQVLILTYGKAYSRLKKIAPTIKINGIRLHFKNNKLAIPTTVFKNISFIHKNIINFYPLIRKIKKFSPDVIITDFEPLTARIARILKKPLISIDNQHKLTHLKNKIPKEYKKDYLIAKFITKLCVPKANAFIILSLSKEKARENVFPVSPIIRKEVIKQKTQEKDKIVVYQTAKNLHFISILEQIDENFIVYGHDKNSKKGNIEFKTSGQHFIKDLAESKAVIASAGFSLISEAIYLKKPIFAIPLKDHFEQYMNALFIKEENYGIFSENPSKEDIEKFIKNISSYKKSLKKDIILPAQAHQTLNSILSGLKPQVY